MPKNSFIFKDLQGISRSCEEEAKEKELEKIVRNLTEGGQPKTIEKK